jgi:hypothetical protein
MKWVIMRNISVTKILAGSKLSDINLKLSASTVVQLRVVKK